MTIRSNKQTDRWKIIREYGTQTNYHTEYKHRTFFSRICVSKYFPWHTQYLAFKIVVKRMIKWRENICQIDFCKNATTFDETSWCYQERRKLPNWQPPAYPDQLLVPDVKGEGHGHLQPLLQHVQLGMGLSWYNRYQGNFTSVYIYVVSFSLHIYKV